MAAPKQPVKRECFVYEYSKMPSNYLYYQQKHIYSIDSNFGKFNSSNPSFRLGRIFVSVVVSYTATVFVGKNRIEDCAPVVSDVIGVPAGNSNSCPPVRFSDQMAS
jgi:hypothetical protein